MKSEKYQPKNAKAIFDKFKFACVVELLASWGLAYETAQQAITYKAVLAMEGLFGNVPAVVIPDSTYVPANLTNPERHGDKFVERGTLHAAMLMDKEQAIPFTFGVIGPKMFIKSNTVMSAFLELKEEEDQMLAMSWMAETMNIGTGGFEDLQSWFVTVGGTYLHNQHHPKMGQNSGYTMRNAAAVAAIDRNNALWWIARPKPAPLNEWLRKNMTDFPDIQAGCGTRQATQEGMMPFQNALKKGKLKLEILNPRGIVKKTGHDLSASENWDSIVSEAIKWASKFEEELAKQKEEAEKPIDPTNTPPWAYSEDGTISLRYKWIVKKDQIPEEHREKAVNQFIEELKAEYEERNGAVAF